MRTLRRLAAAGAVTALVLGLLSFGVQAAELVSTSLAEDEQGDLSVTADPSSSAFFDLTPGDSRYWPVEATLDGADEGTLVVRVWGDGALIDHPSYPLRIVVDACDGTLTGSDPREYPTCSGAVTPIVASQPLRDVSVADDLTGGQAWDLAPIQSGLARSLVVTLTVPAEGSYDESLMNVRGDFGVGLYSSGDVPSVTPEDPDDPEQPPSSTPDRPATMGVLPATGGPVLAVLLIGVGAVGLGCLARTRGREAS
ncbi:MAG: hypothetical protein QM621_08765 [Aeromicrobium sp.]|uniref:hypothetical protein n=1 Tax=Aeromicrobium sp. TaxID=1871063 RepID=UPI0039E6D711